MKPKKAKKLLKLFAEFRHCMELDAAGRLYLDMARVEIELKQIAFPEPAENASNWTADLGSVAAVQPKYGAITRTPGPQPLTRFGPPPKQVVRAEHEPVPDSPGE